MATSHESWRARDARAALRVEARLAGNEDDKCNACGEWTLEAAERYGLEDACACTDELRVLLGEDAAYPDLWGDVGSTRVIPTRPDLLGEIVTASCGLSEAEADEGDERAQRLIWRWARTPQEKAFLEALAGGHDQGEASRLSGLLQPGALLRRIRGEALEEAA